MREPVWVSRRACDTMHLDQVRQHGGILGIRDENALESALARPRNKWAYAPDCALVELAAAYGFGLSTNHGYNDGNKRIAFVAMYVFLGMNGLELDAPEPEVVSIILALADGRLSEDQMADWLAEHTQEHSTAEAP